jgi:hypothetical protein
MSVLATELPVFSRTSTLESDLGDERRTVDASTVIVEAARIQST